MVNTYAIQKIVTPDKLEDFTDSRGIFHIADRQAEGCIQ